MDATALSVMSLSDRNTLKELYAEFNSLRDSKLLACGGDHSTLAYEALDLDLGALLIEILPILSSLLTGGFTLPAVLAIAKVVVGLFLKDNELGAVLMSILEILLKGFVP